MDEMVVRGFCLLQLKPLCDQNDRRKFWWSGTETSRRYVSDGCSGGHCSVLDFLRQSTYPPVNVINHSITNRQSNLRRSLTNKRPIPNRSSITLS